MGLLVLFLPMIWGVYRFSGVSKLAPILSAGKMNLWAFRIVSIAINLIVTLFFGFIIYFGSAFSEPTGDEYYNYLTLIIYFILQGSVLWVVPIESFRVQQALWKKYTVFFLSSTLLLVIMLQMKRIYFLLPLILIGWILQVGWYRRENLKRRT